MNTLRKCLLASGSFLITQFNCLDPTPTQQLPPYIKTKQFNANNPIQDRTRVWKLPKNLGDGISVFDGHGGDLCAEYVCAHIEKVMNQALMRNMMAKRGQTSRQVISKSLEQCYDQLQAGFKAVFKQHINDINYQSVGSCALTVILTPNQLVVANAGDCQSAVFGELTPKKLNDRLNAGQPEQQKRLKQHFPNQQDIYKCIKGTNYCYVKGRLQPTRSFGDFYLKDPQYNFTNIKTFTGPYITHKPIITAFQYRRLIPSFLVVGTDGLWDELSLQQMDNIIKKNSTNENMAEILFQGALKKILERNKISSLQKLLNIKNRRNLHDDISIVTVDFNRFIQERKKDFSLFK